MRLSIPLFTLDEWIRSITKEAEKDDAAKKTLLPTTEN